MIKILYVVAGENDSTGCFRKIDPIFYRDNHNGDYEYETPSDENKAVDIWLRQFGGRLEWVEAPTAADYIVFENDEDATVFALKFGL